MDRPCRGRSGCETEPPEHRARGGADQHGYVVRHLIMTQIRSNFSSMGRLSRTPKSRLAAPVRAKIREFWLRSFGAKPKRARGKSRIRRASTRPRNAKREVTTQGQGVSAADGFRRDRRRQFRLRCCPRPGGPCRGRKQACRHQCQAAN
jgi:hypothetical protein